MDQQALMDIGMSGLILAAKLATPPLAAALIVGFAVSLFQSMTQIQEVTLSFVPKAIAVCVVLAIAGPWMVQEITQFTQELHTSIPALLSGG